MAKLTKNSKENKLSTLLYGLAFIVVLLAILYAQYSYIFQDSNKYYSNYKENSKPVDDENKTNQKESQESRSESQDHNSQLDNNQEKMQDSQDGDDTQDLDLICFEIFQQKAKINLKMLLFEVGIDIDSKLKDKTIKKQEIIKQYEILSKQNLDLLQIKQKFQQMENIFKNQYEESYKNSSEETQQNSEKNNIQQTDKYKQKKDSYLKKIPKQILQKILCFIQHYDDHQNILSFEVLKYSEFIENEYYLLKWENKNTFYDLIIHLYSLLQLKEQINWQSINQEVLEVNSTLIYFAKLLLNDLLNLYKEQPNLFQYIDPYEQELIDIKNSLPMSQVIKNLVDQWEDNWLQMDISYSSHLNAYREEKRQEQFEQLMQTTQLSNERLRQKASQNSQRQEKPFNIEVSQRKPNSQLDQTQHSPEVIKSDQKQLKQDNTNQQMKYLDEVSDKQLDQNEETQKNQSGQKNNTKQNRNINLELNDLFNEEAISQNDFNQLLNDFEKEETKNRQIIQKKLDIKKIIELYSEEDSDEITTLEEKVQELWNSKEWRQIFNDLQYNNYFLAKKRVQYKQTDKEV
ncbi:hypothetical protein ABPG72_005135 [Tetrahymena utriculariae]